MLFICRTTRLLYLVLFLYERPTIVVILSNTLLHSSSAINVAGNLTHTKTISFLECVSHLAIRVAGELFTIHRCSHQSYRECSRFQINAGDYACVHTGGPELSRHCIQIPERHHAAGGAARRGPKLRLHMPPLFYILSLSSYLLNDKK